MVNCRYIFPLLLKFVHLRICTVENDMKITYAACDPRYNTTSAHFFYEADCYENDIKITHSDPSLNSVNSIMHVASNGTLTSDEA